MIYAQLTAGMPLIEIVTAANRFFTHKHIGEKYATLIMARIRRDGELEYVNCGHVPPLLVCNHEVIRPPHGNLPVGLLADATYESDHCSLHAGDRLILVTDGVTEAENARGDFFEDSRLEAVAAKSTSLEDIFSAVANFCGGTPLSDDCTVVELVYSGRLRVEICVPPTNAGSDADVYRILERVLAVHDASYTATVTDVSVRVTGLYSVSW